MWVTAIRLLTHISLSKALPSSLRNRNENIARLNRLAQRRPIDFPSQYRHSSLHCRTVASNSHALISCAWYMSLWGASNDLNLLRSSSRLEWDSLHFFKVPRGRDIFFIGNTHTHTHTIREFDFTSSRAINWIQLAMMRRVSKIDVMT